jgi:hypothetical protein
VRRRDLSAQVNDVLSPATDDQLAILTALAAVYMQRKHWPVFQWVQAVCDDRRIDAVATLAALPRLNWYSATWPTPTDHNLRDDQPIGLTLLGLHHAGASDIVEWALAALRWMADQWDETNFSPIDVVRPEVSASAFLAGVGADAPDLSPLLPELLSKEASLTNGYAGGPDGGGQWTLYLTRRIRAFRDVASIEDYLAMQAEFLLPPTPPPAPRTVQVSPLSLPAQMDYLDAVWQVRFGTRLLATQGTERVARLAVPVAAPEEFHAATSAFAEIVKSWRIAGGTGGHPLQRMRDVVTADMDADTLPAVLDALDDLDAIRTLRVMGQHGGAEARGVEAFKRLGIPYPPSDWSSAWDIVRGVACDALTTLREAMRS